MGSYTQGGTLLIVDTPSSSVGTTQEQEVSFAHCIIDQLFEDITTRRSRLTGGYKRKLELHVLDEGHHIDDDDLRKTECRVSHVRLPHDDESKRNLMRDIVATGLHNAIEARKLPFTHCAVEVREVVAFAFDGSSDRYGKDYAIHIVLTR